MRILVHTIFYRPEPTGVAKYTAEMCEWLAARGHSVEVICPPPYYPHWKIEPPYRQRYNSEQLNAVTVKRCPIWLPSQPSGLKRVLYALSFALSSSPRILARIFRPPDVVFVVEPSLLNALTSLLLAKLTGAISWLHIQDFEIDIAFNMGQLKHSALRSSLVRFESFLMRRFDVVSTISTAMEHNVLQKGIARERIVRFPNWVDTNVIHPQEGASSLRTELGIPKESIVALFSGTLGKKQGLETLIAAARTLHESPGSTPRPILILICGDGPALPLLRKLAEDLPTVRFIPLQPEARLNDLLNLADFHLLPQVPAVSDSVLPSKLLGMMASGKPVIAAVGPNGEIARFLTASGLIVRPGDPAALLAGIQALAADPNHRVQLGKQARVFALENLRHDLILKRFEQQIERRQAKETVPAHTA